MRSLTEGTILLVDDEEKNLKLMGAMLLREGYRVLKANNGNDALEMLKSEDVQAVLLDVMMPGLSGYDVLKKIRENRDLAALPVIIISALMEKEERLKGLQLGADDFISKPFDMDELRAKINTQVKLDYLRRQLSERAKLVKVMNKIDEGIIIADKYFVPVSMNMKAKSLMGIKEAPANIMKYLKENYNEDVRVTEGRTNYILKQKLNKGNAGFFSLTIDTIKDASDAVDSYIYIIKKVE